MKNDEIAELEREARSNMTSLAELDDLAEWLVDQIDGGEECQGRDSRISNYIRLVETISRWVRGGP